MDGRCPKSAACKFHYFYAFSLIIAPMLRNHGLNKNKCKKTKQNAPISFRFSALPTLPSTLHALLSTLVHRPSTVVRLPTQSSSLIPHPSCLTPFLFPPIYNHTSYEYNIASAPDYSSLIRVYSRRFAFTVRQH